MQLTKYFSLEEFACNCGCGAEKEQVEECRKTAEILEGLRERINSDQDLCRYRRRLPDGKLHDFSVLLTCGVRCPKQNFKKSVGGAKNSKHLSTKYEGAADTWVPGLPVTLWGRECSKVFSGCITYTKKNFVHVDRRTDSTYCAVDGERVETSKEA